MAEDFLNHSEVTVGNSVQPGVHFFYIFRHLTVGLVFCLDVQIVCVLGTEGTLLLGTESSVFVLAGSTLPPQCSCSQGFSTLNTQCLCVPHIWGLKNITASKVPQACQYLLLFKELEFSLSNRQSSEGKVTKWVISGTFPTECRQVALYCSSLEDKEQLCDAQSA